MQRSLLLLALLAAPAHAVRIPNETDWARGTGWTYHAELHGLRGAWMYVPDGFSSVAGQRGLVYFFVGCGQMPFQAAQGSGWREAADTYGLVIVIPEAQSPAFPNRDAPNVECFNYGYDGSYGVYRPSRNDPDHRAVLEATRALLADRDLALDPNQIYLSGLSAGGAFAEELACMAPDLFAGFATASAPGIGTAQGTAVMPPPAGWGEQTEREWCLQWADGSRVPNARQRLAEQVVAIASDNNGLRAGVGPFDTSLFNDQTVWDGDKFCPHIYQETRAQAWRTLLGLGAPAPGEVIGRGDGRGCPGGEASRDDVGEVHCVINEGIRRNWTTDVRVARDPQGRIRLAQIEQDTLRHAWPSGPLGPLDVRPTPTRETLRADGFIIEATGEFDRNRTRTAPHGTYGVIYLNDEAFDYPMFLGQLWAENNPRIAGGMVDPEDPPVEPEDPPVEPEDPVGAAAVRAVRGSGTAEGCLRVEGEAEGADRVEVVVPGLGAADARLSGGTFAYERCGLAPGTYAFLARAFDAVGAGPASPPATAAIPAGGGAEVIEGTLTDHANAGRVIRFTPEYFAMRDRTCTFNGIIWECEPFPLYRCGDGPWVEEPPACGAPTPVVALRHAAQAEPAEVAVGEAVTITVTVENDGPDAAAAVYLRAEGATAPQGDCTAVDGVLWCHLGELAVGAEASAALEVVARGAGQGRLTVGLAGAQQPEITEVSAEWLATAAEVPGAGGAGGGGDPEDPPGAGGMGGGAGGAPGGAGGAGGDPADPPVEPGPDAGAPAAPGAPRDPGAPIPIPKDGCQAAPGASGWPALAGLLLLGLVGPISRRRAAARSSRAR